ncbi:hypothetical protein IAU60_002428 [Kwoniella sp. DSM 27419]
MTWRCSHIVAGAIQGSFTTTMPDEQRAQSTTNGEASTSASESTELKAQAEQLIGEGKKAIALKQWEEGVEKYGEALDIMRQVVGEFDPQMAPLLLSYGKALYELAFSQQGVMGKEEPSKEADDAAQQGIEDPSKNGKFVFSADPVSDDEGDEAEAGPSGGEGGAEGADEDELEDDYNAAWEVLDVARTIYQRIVEDNKDGEVREEKLNLADCYLALGDVSCETENFPQAVQDYTSALAIKEDLLPASSRALASVHYQLATVLEFTPNRRSDALTHVEKALESFKARLAELSGASTGGNGQSVSDEVSKLSEKEKEKEVEDVKGLMADLEAKIDELKAAPPAGDIVSESINHLLGSAEETFGGPSSVPAAVSGPVNDLTSMVKKKKPKVVAAVQQAMASAAEAAVPAAQAVQDKVAEAAVAAGQAVQEVGEGMKRDAEGEQGDERAAKKAKAE